MNLEKARIDFDELQKKLAAFGHATALIYYDGETSAPADTVENRNNSLKILNEEIFRLKTCDETMELLGYLDEMKEWLTVRERRCVDYMLKDSKRTGKIPATEYVQYEALRTEAQNAWQEAREADDFEILRPYLARLFDSLRNFAEYSVPDENPYEYWLHDHEESLDIETCDELFNAIRDNVVPLLKRIESKEQVSDACLKGNFSVEAQEGLAMHIMDIMGVNLERVGLASAEHPFVTYLGSHFDGRIATRYSRKDYSSSMYTVMHQAGQVLYETGKADNLAYTVLDSGTPLSLLESQGCFYENIIGRNKSFIEYIYPELKSLFPEPLDHYSADDVYRAVNKVVPSLIRIDSDELTKNIHVMIRYELEKQIMERKLDVKDLADAWREKYRDYLAIEVSSDKDGVLQDIHWPYGAIGYYPVYVLGSAFAAQIAEKMSEDVDIETCIEEGDWDPITKWNKEHIWQHGGLYSSREVMEKFVGVEFSVKPYINYLTKKYTEIYQL